MRPSSSLQVEVCSPRISHLLSFCCDAFTKEQLRNLECLILLRLNFRLAAPTMAFFLDYYTNCMEAASTSTAGDGFTQMRVDRQRSRFARKVCELSLADYAFNKYPPSLIASCALWLAEDPSAGLWGELCTQPAPAQASKSPERSEGDSMEEHVQPACQWSCNHSLAQECKDNLRLLVSLNEETLSTL